MTEQVDLDAIEARAKTRQAIDSPDVLALIGELRQERERADEAEREAEEITTAWLDKDRQIAKAETALSRAEETIEAVRALAQQYIDQPGYGDYYFGLESAGEAVAAILTEYKQKGADRG